MAFNPTVATAIIGVYLIITIAIGVAGWRVLPSKNLEDYLLADRGVHWFVGYFSTAGSQLSALTMLGFVAFYFTVGVSAYLAILVAYVFFTCGVYYFLAPRVWKIGRGTGHITPSDLVRDFYDSDLLGYIVAFGMILALIPYLQVQFTGVGIIITLGTGGIVPVEAGAVFIAIVIAFYTWLGGMKSVAWIDAIQGVMLLGGAFIGGIVLVLTVGGGFETAFATIQADAGHVLTIPDAPPFNWPFVLSFGMVVFLGWVFHPHMWIRIHYFESGRAVENLPWVAGSIFWLTQIGGFLAVLAGAVVIPDAPPDQFMLLMYRDFFPTVVFAVIASAALAAMMSSASSQCHGVGAVASRDISEQIKPEWEQRRHLFVARAATVASIIAAVLLAFAGIPFLLTSGAAAAALATCLMFPQAVAAVYGWSWVTREGAIVGSSAGLVVGLGALALTEMGLVGNPFPSIYPGFWGLIANVVAFGGVSAVTTGHPADSTIREWRAAFRKPFATLESEHRSAKDELIVESDDD